VANPLFSILVAVYNTEKYLAHCLDSVAAQTFTDFEAVIIDDGSTDASGSITDGYAASDRRFCVYHTSNQGLLPARKLARDKARGQFLLHIDSDDFLESDLLEKVKAQFDEHGCDMVIYDFRTIDPQGVQRVETFFDQPVLFLPGNKHLLWNTLLLTRLNSLCIKCFSRDIAQIPLDYNRFRTFAHGEDLLQSAYLVSAARTVAYFNEPLYNYRTGIGMSRQFEPESLKKSSGALDVIFGLMAADGMDTPENILEFKCMCRKNMNNYLGMMVKAAGLRECLRLLKALPDTTVFKNAVLSECDARFTRRQNVKFAMLRAGMFLPVILMQKIKP